MNYLTAQAATRLYEEYKDTEIAFTKEIVKTLRMDPRQVYIKFEGSQWPCIINSTSFTNAKIIIGVSGGAYKALSAKPNATICVDLNIDLFKYEPFDMLENKFPANHPSAM